MTSPFRDDLLRDRLLGPSPIMHTDLEYLIKEIKAIKIEIAKIKKALAENGIKID